MVRALSVAGLLLCATSCSDAACVALPCPLAIAVTVNISSGSSSKPLENAFVKSGGYSTGSCAQGGPTQCWVDGGSGHYELDIGAPGFITVHQALDVKGDDAGCSKCASAETQHISIVLVPVG